MLRPMQALSIISALVLAPGQGRMKGSWHRLVNLSGLRGAPTARSGTRTRLLWAFSQLQDARARYLLWELLDDAQAFTIPDRNRLIWKIDSHLIQNPTHYHAQMAEHAGKRRGLAVRSVWNASHGRGNSWVKLPVDWMPHPDIIPEPGANSRWDPWIPWLASECARIVRWHDENAPQGYIPPHGLSGHGDFHEFFRGYPVANDIDWIGFDERVGLQEEGYRPGGMPDVIDWIEEERPNIMGMSIGEVQRRSHEWHQQFIGQADYKSPVTPGVTVVTWPDGWHIDRLVTAKECEEEGKSMGHCVGGHWSYVREGTEIIFSIRDDSGKPWGTAALSIDENHVGDDLMLTEKNDDENWYPPYGWKKEKISKIHDGEIPIRGEWTMVVDLKGHDNHQVTDKTAAKRMKWFLDSLLDTDLDDHVWALGGPSLPLSIPGGAIPEWMKRENEIPEDDGEDEKSKWTLEQNQKSLSIQEELDCNMSWYQETYENIDNFEAAINDCGLRSFYSDHGYDEEEWGDEEFEEHGRREKKLASFLEKYITDRHGQDLIEYMAEVDKDELTVFGFAKWMLECFNEHDASVYGQETWANVKAELEFLSESIDGVIGKVSYNDFESHGGDWVLELYEDSQDPEYSESFMTIVANGSHDWIQIPRWDVHAPDEDRGYGTTIASSKHSALDAMLKAKVLVTVTQKKKLDEERVEEEDVIGEVTSSPEHIWLHPDITVPMTAMSRTGELTLDRDQRRTLRKVSKGRAPATKIAKVKTAAAVLREIKDQLSELDELGDEE